MTKLISLESGVDSRWSSNNNIFSSVIILMNEREPADAVFPARLSISFRCPPLPPCPRPLVSRFEGLRSGMYLYICYVYSLIAVIII